MTNQETVQRKDSIDVIRNVANTVSVLTTDGKARCHGATISAFCSVSADPPSMLICLKSDTLIAQTVEKNRVFCVNVLSDEQSNLAHHFAGFLDDTIDDRFIAIKYAVPHPHSPSIIDDISALSCKVNRVETHGTFSVIFGDAVAAHPSENKPLVYLQGAYYTSVPQNLS